jgi:hypothetical protein
MALGVEYEDVLRCAPLAWRDGLSRARYHAIAKSFGVRFRMTRSADIDDATGLLWVDFPKTSHLTYIHHGVLIDPADGSVWKPTDYLSAKGGEGFFYANTPLQHGRVGGRDQARRRG